MTTLNVNITMEQFMMLFQQFPKKEQQTIAKSITDLTFSKEWQALEKTLPDVEMSDDDIMNEIYAVRYGKD